jgi:uronate dehydrogenase
MRVVITGAAGEIGSEITEELAANHELCLIDKAPLSKQPSIVADLAQHRDTNYWKPWSKTFLSNWGKSFEGIDVVVHLAANREALAPWEVVLPDNIQATWNVIETAAKYRVPRVVFASSNWAVKAMEQNLAPACYQPNGPKIGSDALPCPVNPYGLSKAFGEHAGRMFVDDHKLPSFLAVRIGHFRNNPSEDEALRSVWIGAHDIRSLFRRCVEAEIEGFHVVYGVSAQKTAPYDLSHTSQLLSWFPRQLPDGQRFTHNGNGRMNGK